MQHQELIVRVHISFLFINLEVNIFFTLKVSQGLEVKLRKKDRVDGFQAPNFNKWLKKSQLKSVAHQGLLELRF